MAISKNDLVRDLLPELNKSFEEYNIIQLVLNNEALKKKEQNESNIKVSADYSI